MRLRLICVVSLIIPFLCISLFPKPGLARDQSTGVAQFIQVEDNMKDGQVVMLKNGRYFAALMHDEFTFAGIVKQKPAVALGYASANDRVAIVDSGETTVLVSGENGDIKAGDRITASYQMPGYATKATEGQVIGYAKSSVSFESPEDTGSITLAIQPGTFGETSVGDGIHYRTIVAGTIVTLSFMIALFTFSRVAANGVLAIGRNPLAEHSIQAGILLNIMISLAMIGSGVVLGLAVLMY